MSPNNNNIRGLNVKRCPNKCKTWIAWSPHLNRFVEAKSGQIHHCPKWKKAKQQQRTSPMNFRTLKTEEVTYIDTIGPAIAEIHYVVQEILKMLQKGRNEKL